MRIDRAWLLAGFLALLLPACSAEDEGGLPHQVLTTCVKVPAPTEEVFRSAPQLQAFYARYGAAGSEPAVDFGRSMVAARFDGEGSACVGFSVEEVAARDGQVVVEATRHTSPNPCIAVLAYPQLVISVERRDLPVTFRIRSVRDTDPGQTRPCF